MEATAAKHDDARVRRGLRTKAAKRRARAGELDPPEESPAGGGAAARPGALPRKETQATTGGRPADGAQANFTDPESSIMKGADGFVQGYNAQLAVDEEAQVIVAQGVTDQPPDNGNLAPMIERVEGHLDETPANATADAGYWNPEAEDRARALGTEAWVSTERRRHGGEERSDSEAEPADIETDPLKRMRSRLASEEGRALLRPAQGGGRAGQRPDQARPGLSAVLLPGTGGGRGGVGPGVPVPQPAQDVPKPARRGPGRPAPERRGAPGARRTARSVRTTARHAAFLPFATRRYPRLEPAHANIHRNRPESANPGPPAPVNPARQLQPPSRLRPGKRLRRTDS